MRFLWLSVSAFSLISSSALADEKLQGRAEINGRMGHERSIIMSEFWVPLVEGESSVLYGDLRLMGDDQNNREGNLGVGYRNLTSLPILGDGVAGVNGWFDRRITERGSTFHQLTGGAEWFGTFFDIRLNGYLPISDKKQHSIPNANPQAPALSGTGIVVDTNGTLIEEPQRGLDLELGFELGQYIDFAKEHTDSFRIYGGGYYFDGDYTEDVTGWRARIASDVTENIQIGTRFQHDDVRGSQGFLEATLRFPFGTKTSYRSKGLRARLDESPERDIDIVTGAEVTDRGDRVQVLNRVTGATQEVLNVDNMAANGGDGSAEAPFNTLAAAEAAANEQTIIYVRYGSGSSAGQNQGITLNKKGQQLIGSGTNFIYDNAKFTTANGASPTSVVVAAAGAAPVIGNINALGDGVKITADDITVAGVIVDNGGTGRDGIVVEADGASASARNVTIQNVTTQNSRMGIYLHGANNGTLSAKVQNSITTSNSQHGIAVYDDTDASFEVDLGGGTMGSAGNNVLAGNTLEDLAVDYDGRALFAQNNWWGQSSGPDKDDPSIGIAPQIYYGAPINDGLVGHWTFDSEWTSNSTAYDRSGQNNDGNMIDGLTLADQESGILRETLNFDNGEETVEINQSASLNSYIDTTWAQWVKIDIADFTASHDMSLNAGAAASYISIYSGCGILEPFVSMNIQGMGQQTMCSNQSIASDTWAHVLFSYDGLNIKSYINGDLTRTSANLAGRVITSTQDLRIGDYTSAASNDWFGEIDDTRIYSRALNSTEISELYRMNTSSTVNTGSYLRSAP